MSIQQVDENKKINKQINGKSNRRVKTLEELLKNDEDSKRSEVNLRNKQINKHMKGNSKRAIKTEYIKNHDVKLREVMLTNTALKNRLTEANAAVKKLKDAQLLIMDWARQQEWEFPQHIRKLLPKDKKFMREAALQRVPHGKSPAEYTFNLLYFFSLTASEQEALGAKVFEREKGDRPEDFAALEFVTKELNDFLFYFPDENVKMMAEYGYLACMVPKQSTNPRSDWVVLKKLALSFFPVYTRVTVKRAVKRTYTWSNVKQTDNAATIKYNLIAERSDDHYGTRRYHISIKCDSKTGQFTLADTTYKWEIVNYGICWYSGHFEVSNLVMDNNPPYKEGMRGIVEIHWTGSCIYDTSED
jgi:hypothetical protein